MKKYFWIILSFVLLSALFVRFTEILAVRDFWYDEAFTGILLRAPFAEMNDMIFRDVHPPLYYWLAKPWATVFGYTPFAIRLLSLLFGMLTIISAFWIGRKMFNVRAGILTATFLAFSPFAIVYSQEARMYSLFGFLMLWAVWFFYKALKKERMIYWVFFGVFAGLSYYTHYLSLFFFIMFYVAYVIYQKKFNGKKLDPRTLKNPKDRRKKQFTLAERLNNFAFIGGSGFWVAVGVIFLFFLSWIRIFFGHMMKGNLGWIDPTHLSNIPETLQIFFFGHPPGTGGTPWSNEFAIFFDGTSAGLLILAIFLIVVTVAWMKGVKRKEIIILTVMSLGTLLFLIVLSHFNIKLYVARYFMPATVLFFLLFAGILTTTFSKRKSVWLITVFVYVGMILMLKPVTYSSTWTEVWNLKSLGVITDNHIIVTNGPFEYTSAKYYFGEEKVRFYNPGNPTEDFSGWVVVGNKNRIDNVSEIKKNPNFVIVDRNCDWEGLDLTEVRRLSNASVCKIGKMKEVGW